MSVTAPFKGRVGRWQWVLQSEWPAVWRPSEWNWTDFTFVKATVERVRYLDTEESKGWDVWLGLLGFVFGISNCYGYAHNDEPSAPDGGGGERG